jgi:hypothetical protein
MIARQAGKVMATENPRQKSYSVLARLVFRRDRIMKSRIVPIGKFDTFDEANRVARTMRSKEFQKKAKGNENCRLAEIRAEVFIRTDQGEYRIRTYIFKVAPVRWS